MRREQNFKLRHFANEIKVGYASRPVRFSRSATKLSIKDLFL